MQCFELDLNQPGGPQLVHAKQGDVGRIVRLLLYEGGVPYAPADGAFCIAYYKTSAGSGNYSENILIENNAVTLPLPVQMLGKAGGGALCLVLYDTDGGQLGWWNLLVEVEEVPGGLDSAAVTEWYTALSEVVGQTAANLQACREQVTVAQSYATFAADQAAKASDYADQAAEERGKVNVQMGAHLTASNPHKITAAGIGALTADSAANLLRVVSFDASTGVLVTATGVE